MVYSRGYHSDLDTITFDASEEISVNSITLEKFGLAKANAIEYIWLEDENGKEVANKKAVNSKDLVSLSINKDYRTFKGKKSFVIVVSTPEGSGSSDLGTNIGFKVTEVNSTASDQKINVSKNANKYPFADYTADGVKVENKGSDKKYDYVEDKMYEVAKMKIISKDVAIKISGLTLTNSGDVDLDDIEKVEVLMDGEKVKNVDFSVKKDDLTVTFAEQEIAIKSNAVLTINVSFANFEDFGKHLQFSVKSSDVNMKEVKNDVRVKIDPEELGFSKYEFGGSKIEFVNEKLSSSIDIPQGGEGTIAKGTVKVNNQSIKTQNATVVALDFGSNTISDIKKMVESVELLINGVSEAEVTSFAQSGTDNIYTGKFNSFFIDEDSDIELVVHLDTDAQSGVSFNVSLNDNGVINGATFGAKYDVKNGGEINSLGSISISSVKVQSAKSSLVNNQTKKVEFKTKESDSKVVFEGTYTTKKQDVKVNEVRITRNFDGVLTGSDIELTAYINGKAVASVTDKNFKNISGTQNESFADITVEAEGTIDLKVIANVYASEAATGISYSIALYGEDANNNEVKTSPVKMATIDFVDMNNITITNNAATKQKDVVLSDKDQVVANFIVKPSNKAESAIISTVSLSGIVSNTTKSDLVEDDFIVRINGTDYADELNYDNFANS